MSFCFRVWDTCTSGHSGCLCMWWAVVSTQHIAGKDANKDVCWYRAGWPLWKEAGSIWEVRYGGILSPEKFTQGWLPKFLFVNAKMLGYYIIIIIIIINNIIITTITTIIIISSNQKRVILKTVYNDGLLAAMLCSRWCLTPALLSYSQRGYNLSPGGFGNRQTQDLILFSRDAEGGSSTGIKGYWGHSCWPCEGTRWERPQFGHTPQSCVGVASTMNYWLWHSSLNHLVENTAIPLCKL